jgi:tetrahydromethanopterin S-methyltransferase subunit E
MDIVALIALVVAITQVLKQVIKIDPNIIAVAVSILVVAYEAVASGTPFTFALIVILVQVVIGAIGSFKVAKQVFSPTPK